MLHAFIMKCQLSDLKIMYLQCQFKAVLAFLFNLLHDGMHFRKTACTGRQTSFWLGQPMIEQDRQALIVQTWCSRWCLYDDQWDRERCILVVVVVVVFLSFFELEKWDLDHPNSGSAPYKIRPQGHEFHHHNPRNVNDVERPWLPLWCITCIARLSNSLICKDQVTRRLGFWRW